MVSILHIIFLLVSISETYIFLTISWMFIKIYVKYALYGEDCSLQERNQTIVVVLGGPDDSQVNWENGSNQIYPLPWVYIKAEVERFWTCLK